MGRYRVRLVTVVRADSVIYARTARSACAGVQLLSARDTLLDAGFGPEEVVPEEPPERYGWEWPAKRIDTLPSL